MTEKNSSEITDAVLRVTQLLFDEVKEQNANVDAIERRIADKLEMKADKTALERLDERVRQIEVEFAVIADRVRNRAIAWGAGTGGFVGLLAAVVIKVIEHFT